MYSRSRSIQSKQFLLAAESLFSCPACSILKFRAQSVGRVRGVDKRRWASNLASSTAVNSTKCVPSKNKDLYEALVDLRRKASIYTNLSRLRLAIQGLESESPTTRIAVLGLNVSDAARRLAHLLLVDPSKPRQEWEGRLETSLSEQGQGLIVRFGSPPNEALQTPRSVLSTLVVPAPILRDLSLEILITSAVDASDPEIISGSGTSPDLFLCPTVGTPLSTTGRQYSIIQPVHRAVMVADGSRQFLSVSELLARTRFESRSERDLVGVVLNLSTQSGGSDSKTMLVDLDRAERGLQAFREGGTGALDFEREWAESGVKAFLKSLSDWSVEGGLGISSLLHGLIATMLQSTAANVASQAEEAQIRARSMAVSPQSRLLLENAIDMFSRQGHTELQTGLAAAWSSRNWRKLAFWKLFWRVDDVSLIVADLISTAWLPRTEHAVYELCGRMKQAGIITLRSGPTAKPAAAPEPQVASVSLQAGLENAASAVVHQPLVLASGGSFEALPAPVMPPAGAQVSAGSSAAPPSSLTSAISVSRQGTMAKEIAKLTTSAQKIVLEALTIIGVSGAMSGLSFLSVTSGSIYESATILALGTAYALRRMQKEWECQCRDLENDLMDEGRLVLKRTEAHVRRLVKEASIIVRDEADLQARTEAADAVQRATEALEKLGP
jgi:hypothetical protein